MVRYDSTTVQTHSTTVRYGRAGLQYSTRSFFLAFAVVVPSFFSFSTFPNYQALYEYEYEYWIVRASSSVMIDEQQ